MSPEYVLDPCWNCGTSRIAARFGGETVLIGTHAVLKTRFYVWVCLFVCNNCNKGTIVELVSGNANARPSHCEVIHETKDSKADQNIRNELALMLLPASLKKYKDGSTRVFAIMATSPSASVGMFRKTLEATLDHIDKQSSRTRLSDRITKLCSNNKLTPEMGEWAQAIRTIAGMGYTPTTNPLRDKSNKHVILQMHFFNMYSPCQPSSRSTIRNKVRRIKGSEVGIHHSKEGLFHHALSIMSNGPFRGRRVGISESPDERRIYLSSRSAVANRLTTVENTCSGAAAVPSNFIRASKLQRQEIHIAESDFNVTRASCVLSMSSHS